MPITRHSLSALAALAGLAAPATVLAQRAGDNAVANSEDAFGSQVGLETTGIYSDQDTRGFSPSKAGNMRIDGIYFDLVGVSPSRLRQVTAVRIGFAAEDYPFQAPTGIVDTRFRPLAAKNGASVTANLMPYGGQIYEADVRLRNAGGTLGLNTGISWSDYRFGDGSKMLSWAAAARPIVRLGGAEIAPWVAVSDYYAQQSHVLAIVSGEAVPKVPEQRRFLGQTWALTRLKNNSYGVTAKVPITDRLALRSGFGYSDGGRSKNFSEYYVIAPQGEEASHRLIADPAHAIHSASGEVQLAYRFGRGRWQHRLIAGLRMRNRLTETGGSHPFNFGTVDSFGIPDPEPQPVFRFGAVNSGRVKQSAIMLGYSGKLSGVGLINLGVQKARYRATNRDGTTGAQTASRDDPWLYNATIGVELAPALSLYFGTQRGLEDSGIAPETAINRNVQLPATRSTQYDGGLRWKFHGGQLVVNAFQITKPYFSYDAAGLFTEIGQVRHRGVEASLSGRFGKRLQLIAGALAMQPRVTVPPALALVQGERPTGTPSLFLRIDANYKTDLFGGLTPTFSLVHTGARAVGSRPLASLGGKQLMVPGVSTIDLGLRQQFKLGAVPMNIRAVVQNVFNALSWKVVAPNALMVDERRRFSLNLVADF